MNGIIIREWIRKVALASFVKCRLCDIYIASCKRVWATIISRVPSWTVTSIIGKVSWRLTIHDLFIIIISGYDFIWFFRIPILLCWVDLIPASIVNLLNLNVHSIILARWSSKRVRFLIRRIRVSFINDLNFFNDIISIRLISGITCWILILIWNIYKTICNNIYKWVHYVVFAFWITVF